MAQTQRKRLFSLFFTKFIQIFIIKVHFSDENKFLLSKTYHNLIFKSDFLYGRTSHKFSIKISIENRNNYLISDY